MLDKMNRQFKVYENAETFCYVFPDSKFAAIPPGQRNQITYEQKNIVEEENTFRDGLTDEQVSDIARTGEFKVKSNIQYITQPYIWKINQSILWGR